MSKRTVKKIIENLYEWVNATQVFESDTGEHLSFEDYQYIISEDVSELADLLGIDLSEVANHEGDKEQNNN